MQKTVFIVAFNDEIENIKDFFDMRKTNNEHYYVSNTLPNLSMVVTGVGLKNVLIYLTDCINKNLFSFDDNFINIGFVGSPLYNIGDIVQIKNVKRLFEPKKVSGLNKNFETNVLFNDKYKTTTLYTADDFVENQDLPEQDCVVDMEGYYITCMFNNIKIIKIVSDNLCMKDCDNANRSDIIRKSWNKILKDIKNSL